MPKYLKSTTAHFCRLVRLSTSHKTRVQKLLIYYDTRMQLYTNIVIVPKFNQFLDMDQLVDVGRTGVPYLSFRSSSWNAYVFN